MTLELRQKGKPAGGKWSPWFAALTVSPQSRSAQRMIKEELPLLSAPRIFIWRALRSTKKTRGLTVKRTKTVTSQLMYSKFLIALSSIPLALSTVCEGRACMGACVSGGLHPKQRRHCERAAARGAHSIHGGCRDRL